MPNDQKDMERIRALLEGEQRVKSLTAALQSLTDAALKEAAAAQAQGQTQAQLNSIWAKHLPQLLQHSRDLNEAAGSLASSKRNLGMATMFLGNSIQDFQAAGIRGILNNIPQVIMAFGGGAGLAGVLTVAAVAFEQFRPQIEKLAKEFGIGIGQAARYATEIEKLTEKMERLDKTRKDSANDWAEYREAEMQKQEIEKNKRVGQSLLKTAGPREKAIGSAVPGELGGKEMDDAFKDVQRQFYDERMDIIRRENSQRIEDIEKEERESPEHKDSILGWLQGIMRRRSINAIIEDELKAKNKELDEAAEDLGKLFEDVKSGDGHAAEDLIDRIAESNTVLAEKMRRLIADAMEKTPAVQEEARKSRSAEDSRVGRGQALAQRILDRQGSADVSPENVTLDGVKKQLEEMEISPEDVEELAAYVLTPLKAAAHKLAEKLSDHADELEDEKLEKSNEEWVVVKRDRDERSRKRIAKFMLGRPDINADTESEFLLKSMAEGATETERRASGEFGRDQSRTKYGRRWKRVALDAAGNVRDKDNPGFAWGFAEVRKTHRNLSLGEARDALENRLYEEYVKAGSDRETARAMAKSQADQAYGNQMQRGYGALKQLNEMAMTGQLGRGVQVMGSEQYIDSVQTAREGIDKQMLDVQKKAMEANVFVAEWFRRNPGLPARVGKKKVK